MAPWPSGSKLPALRRQQLINLADAFGVTVNRDGVKDDILTAILASPNE